MSIFQLLSGLGKVSVTVREKIEKEMDEDQLLEWLRLAAQSCNREEFLEKM